MSLRLQSVELASAAPQFRGTRTFRRAASLIGTLRRTTLVGAASGLCLGLAAADGSARPSAAGPVVQANRNTVAAGTLVDGVLTVALEAKPSLWYLDGPKRPAMTIEAFSEAGKPPQMPAPLLRVPAGTELRLTIRNSLSRPLTFNVPVAVHGGPDRQNATDSVVVAAGAVGTLTIHAGVPGNYVYRGETPLESGKVDGLTGLLAGAIVIDRARAVAPPRDRVFVIMATKDAAEAACRDTITGDNALQDAIQCGGERLHYTINGKSWPSTERLHATVGDSLHWRVINASQGLPHPMHLHGFYYRIDSYRGQAGAQASPPIFPGQMVVTQLLRPYTAMSITWSPDRPGNWLFHCHTAMHTTPPDTLPAAADGADMSGMVGLVLGTIVAPRAGVVSAGHPFASVRRLRLVAEEGPGVLPQGLWRAAVRDSVPVMHFVLEEQGRRTDTRTDLSPELDLVRDEPVAITIVNHLSEPTSVHWHGIEIEDSYMDGAPGFSGAGTHLSPAIAPGDSFVARFTPPRAGTFMYHAHVDDVREQLAGLEGALIVRDRGASSSDDHVFFFKGWSQAKGHPLEINGEANPDTVVVHAGRTARLRFMNLSMNVPSPSFFLTARPDSVTQIANDTMLVRWRLVAKDGFDLPAGAQVPRPAHQIVGMGETWDVEFTPERRGALNLEVRESGAGHELRVRVPIRVE
ncbi:MAG: multicopper oxidase domain-containing protein [Gemmatimonadales bacterium]